MTSDVRAPRGPASVVTGWVTSRLPVPADGALLVLLGMAVVLGIAAEWLPGIAFVLARDLPWAGVAWSGLGLWGTICGRRGPRRLLAAEPEVPGSPIRWRYVLLTTGLLCVLTFAAPLAGRSARGLTLTTGHAWNDTGHPTRVRNVGLGRQPGGPVTERQGAPLAGTLTGWLYVPVGGQYGFVLETEGSAILALDATPVVAVGDPPEPVGEGGQANLAPGLHRLLLRSLHAPGPASLGLRWILPGTTRPARLPRAYLLADEGPASRRWLAFGGLVLQRVAALALALQLAWILAHATRLGLAAAGSAGIRSPVVGAFSRHRPPDPLLFLLLFFLLTGYSILFAPAHLAALRVGLVGILAATLAGAGRGLAHVRARLGRPRPWVRTGLAVASVALLQLLLTQRFLGWVAGRLVTSDDFGSFLYDYRMLDQVFPRLLPYDPWWNAGTPDDALVLTGAPLVWLLLRPLAWLGPLTRIYAAVVPLTVVIVGPWAIFGASRLLGFSRLAAVVATLLAVAPEETFYFWLFSSGSLPFLVAAAWSPLLVALAWRVFGRRDRRGVVVGLLVVIAAVGCYSPYFPLMVLPALVPLAVVAWPRVDRRQVALALLVAAAVLLVQGVWVRRLLALPTVAVLAGAANPPLADAARRMADLLVFSFPSFLHPVGLILGIAALSWLPRGLRATYAGFVAALALVTVVVSSLRPETQLLRFTVPLGFALLPPAAHLVARWLRGAPRAGGAGFFRAASLLLVLGLSGVEAWARFGGDSPVPNRRLDFLPDETQALAEWIRTEARADARVLLTPPVIHDYGGHVGFLQILTGHAFMADCHYHHPICPPGPGLGDSDAALHRYAELFNVRYVITTHETWQRRLGGVPWLAHRASFNGIAVYETDVPPTYLLEGRGTVRFGYDRLAVELAAPADTVVLKFRWAEGLITRPPLPLDRVEVAPGTWFIRVRTGGARAFEVLH